MGMDEARRTLPPLTRSVCRQISFTAPEEVPVPARQTICLLCGCACPRGLAFLLTIPKARNPLYKSSLRANRSVVVGVNNSITEI
jgi:hypothetical protein